MKKPAYVLAALWCVAALAQSLIAPLQWRVETSRPQAVELTLFRGETVALQPRFESFANGMQLPTNATVRLLYRSANMTAGTYHQIQGSLLSETGRVSVVWTPAADNGATLYDYSLVVTNALQGALARAHGKIKITGTVFGQAANPIILTNGYAAIEALNAHIADTDNPHQVTAAQVGAYTSGQTDTLLASKATTSALAAHTGATNNPHQVTAAQVGAYTTAQTDALISGVIASNGVASVNGLTGPVTISGAGGIGVATNGNDIVLTASNLLVAVESVGGPFLAHFASMTSDTLYRGSAGSVTTSTVVDAIRTTQTISTAVTDYLFRATYARNTTGADFTYSSSNPSVATVNSAGLASWVSNGSATITVVLGDFSLAIPRTFASFGTRIETNLAAGVATYFRHAVTSPIDTAIASDAGANDDELFDTKDWVGHSYVRNASCWAYTATGGATPWTGIPVWRTGKTGTGPSIGGALISSNVVAFAWHNRPAIGSQVRWLGSNGTVYLRTITATARVGTGDACVALVDSPLPSVVVPVKVLAADYTTRLITAGPRGTQLPAITINKNLQASVQEHIETAYGYDMFRSPLIASRAPYYYLPISGDSGSPVLFVVGSQLVLIATWYTPGGGSTFQASSDLTAAVTALGGVQPVTVDLSSYPANTPPGP